ncbi:MAG TPA: ABC transporter permease [Kofleriaceae bacterium]|nr:ABC transporter permease [Kofleriaceae bacterium]
MVGGIAVMIFVATFSFFSMRLAPGGPFDGERALPAEIKHNLEQQYHLDEPLIQQYGRYMVDLAHLDLGHSMIRTKTVKEIIWYSVPKSMMLGLLALGFAILFGVGLGVIAASKQNSLADHGAMAFALFGISIPSIVLGPLLIFIFSLQFYWLPPARFEGFASMILPAATLGLIFMGVVSRLARTGLLETLRQDYIRTARAKGLSERKVVWKHAVRLGLLPVVTYLGPAIAALITGSFVVEKIFQVPGLGFYFVASITDRDYTVLSGVLVFYSGFLVVLNFLVDVAYGFLDPRIRTKR